MKRDWFNSLLVGGLVAVTALTLVFTSFGEYNIGTGFLARVYPVIAEGNMVAVTTAGTLYDSGVSAYSVGSSAIKNDLRATGWTDTLGGASLHALEHAFAEYADIKITGPSSSIDEQLVRYNGATGKVAQASYVYIDDTGNMTFETGATVDGVDISALNAAIGTTATSTADNQICRYNGITKNLQASYVYIDDSANITTTGTVDGVDVSDVMTTSAMASAIMTFGKIKTVQASYDTSGGITDAVCDNALGAPGTLGAGYQATIKASIGSALYAVETDGTAWFFVEKAVAP